MGEKSPNLVTLDLALTVCASFKLHLGKHCCNDFSSIAAI
jgi:hypothetical protein